MPTTILPQKRGGRSRDYRNSRCSHQIRRQLGKAHLSVHRRQNALPARIRYCVLSLDAYRRLRYLPENSPLGLFLFYQPRRFRTINAVSSPPAPNILNITVTICDLSAKVRPFACFVGKATIPRFSGVLYVTCGLS